VQAIDAPTVRRLFETKAFAMLLNEGLIGQDLVSKILSSWKHTGFDVFCGLPAQDVKKDMGALDSAGF